MRSREASAKMSQEGGLPTKCHAQNAKNQEVKKPKSKGKGGKKQKGGTKVTCSGSARAHCKASGCICLKERKKRKEEEKEMGMRKGVFIGEGDGVPEAQVGV